MLLNAVMGLPIHQAEVDFVIPNLREDLALYVDPFLFYKSSDKRFQAVHTTLRAFFDRAVGYVKQGTPTLAHRMMNFPEVRATMLGLSSGDHHGRGLGSVRGRVIYDEIVANKDIEEHGISHLAQMQLLIMNVGFDMVSDMCTNIAKPFFVQYTQDQCRLHAIPVEHGVCLEHVFDWEEDDWDDVIADLPVNPLNAQPILLVPKAVVRRFEEIDYKDFWRTTYRYILRDIEVQKSLQAIGREPKITWKEIDEKYRFCKSTVVEVLHEQPDLMRQYLKTKEDTTAETAAPVDLKTVDGTDRGATPVEDLVAELQGIAPGNAQAKAYERLMVRILTLLFSPPLMDPREQVRSADDREIKDITFHNAATSGFWHDIKQNHGSVSVPVELKNMADIGNPEVFQIAARLNDIQGYFGLLIARGKDAKDTERVLRRMYLERKFILILDDADIERMLDNHKNGLSPVMHITRIYRDLKEAA